MTAPLAVDAGALNVNVSLLPSAPTTVPVTTPVPASGLPTVALPVGATLNGAILTVTGIEAVAPNTSVTVTLNVSVRAAGSDPAALRRAVDVGV